MTLAVWLVHAVHMDITQNTADRVAAAIARKGWSIQRTANESAIPYTTLYRKAKGGADFTMAEIGALADALEVSPSTLLPASWTVVAVAV